MKRAEVACLECGYRGWAVLVEEGGRQRVHNMPLAAWCVHRSAACLRVVETGELAMLIPPPG